jgi:hypothetical protein
MMMSSHYYMKPTLAEEQADERAAKVRVVLFYGLLALVVGLVLYSVLHPVVQEFQAIGTALK